MSSAHNRSRLAAPLIVIAVLLVQTLTHLAWLPISAHSGQVAIPWMMNQGRTLFGDLLEQHAPATSLIAALAQRVVGGDPVLVDRLLNLLLVLALTLLIFNLARHLAGTVAGVIAALIWFWWEPVYGNVLFYFDSLVGLMIMLALTAWISLERRQPGWFAPVIAGLLLGGATLAKQHAWLGLALFGLWLLLTHRRLTTAYVVGALILPLAAVLVTVAQGTFADYIYWNWTFNLSGLMDALLPTGDLVRKLLLSNLFVPAFVLLALRQAVPQRRNLWLLIAALWLSTTVDLLPRFSDDQAMAHLPLASVIGGVVLALLLPAIRSLPRRWRQITTAEAVLVSVGVMALLAWLWTGIAVYGSAPLGHAGIPAYDEFQPLAVALKQVSQPGDTLFVLPETDSTPQIHVVADLLPPSTWIKGWSWYFEAPGVLNRLSSEWQADPPTYIVYFPDLIAVGQPGIAQLVAFMNDQYEFVETVPAIVFHGDAIIYRYRDASE